MAENIGSIDKAVAVLNEALWADPEAVYSLIRWRSPCNSLLAAHPTIQVKKSPFENGPTTLSALGLINGLFGCGVGGSGFIAMEMEGYLITRFVRLDENGATVAPATDVPEGAGEAG